MKKGFTLPEILVAVMIVAILAVMAVPQYEKAVEKSRKAEVVATLKKLHESKMRMLDTLEETAYQDGRFGIQNLDFGLPCTNSLGANATRCETKDFTYCLRPNISGSSSTKEKNAVCAIRNGGDYSGTAFIYFGEEETDASNRFLCNGSQCHIYGMTSGASIGCTC